ncbi:hypothetical protein Tco_0460112, partial [Tanacetum coccineum]
MLSNPEEDLKDYAIIDSGCSGSMTGDKDKLSDFKEFQGGYVDKDSGCQHLLQLKLINLLGKMKRVKMLMYILI